ALISRHESEHRARPHRSGLRNGQKKEGGSKDNCHKQQHPSILAVKCNTGAEDQQNRANHDHAHAYKFSNIGKGMSLGTPRNRSTAYAERTALGAITSQPVLGGLHHQYCRISRTRDPTLVPCAALVKKAGGASACSCVQKPPRNRLTQVR